MAKTELKTDAATFALRAAAIVGVMYGMGFLLMPHSMFQLSGDPGVPTNPGWVRWAVFAGLLTSGVSAASSFEQRDAKR
jgi:hypothetical protein